MKRYKKKVSTKKTKNTELDNQIKYLQVLIGHSINAADGKSEELDKLFTNQANKLKLQLDKLKENQ
jgi:hypothetical protein